MKKTAVAGPNLPPRAFARHALATLELLARKIAVGFHDSLSLLAAGGASEHLSLVPEVTEIVIGRALRWGRELSAIRAGRWFVICAKTSQSLLILHGVVSPLTTYAI